MSVEMDLEHNPGALLCWPVEWEYDDYKLRAVENPHITALYWPEVTTPKRDILSALIDHHQYGRYGIREIGGVDAFGPDRNVPVLTLTSTNGYYSSFETMRTNMISRLTQAGITGWDDTYRYTPHVAVTLEVVLNRPKRLIYRPLELWYQDDEPVAV